MSWNNIQRRDLLKLGGIAAASSLVSVTGLPLRSMAAEVPKKGGHLRVAVLGGGQSDTLDAHQPVSPSDGIVVAVLYDTLLFMDNNGKISNNIAESLEPNSTASEWTIRLRDVEFHDGRKVTANDVIATFRRILNPAAPLSGAVGIAAMDIDNAKAIDEKTVFLPMKTPCAALPELLAYYAGYGIVPADYDPAKPVGTGPFKYESFSPGQEAVFTRFDGYFKGAPHLDKLTIVTSMRDDNTAYNALTTGDIDIFTYAPLTLARKIESEPNGPVRAHISNPGQWIPFTMRVDTAPFDNPDVRTAFKLMLNRQQIIKNALSGYGEVANDIFCPLDVDFNHDLKRPYDPDKAKALLKKAGVADLQVDLVTAEISTGAVQSAQIFAQQAKAIGVTINVKRFPTDVFWSQNYKVSAFSQNFWGYSPFISQVSQCMIKGAPYNETYWDDPTFTKLYNEAQATVDPGKRHELVRAMQDIEFDKSGYIIPSFNVIADLMLAKVKGFGKSSNGYPLGTFAFADAWLDV